MRSVILIAPFLASCSLLVIGLSPDLDLCGNGIIDPGEECDDANSVNNDLCNNQCKITNCGNGVVDALEEECDDANQVEGDGCDTNCTISACGNGITGIDEECDDANDIEGDGCDSNCTISSCGNGIFAPGEICLAENILQFPIEILSNDALLTDLNGDSRLDLVIATGSIAEPNGPEDDLAIVLLGDGDGTFQFPQSFPVGNFPVDVEAGDLNGDNAPDLIVVNSSGDTVSLLLGNGNGTFQPQITFSNSDPTSVAIGDFNGDDGLDFAVASSTSFNVNLFLNDGLGNFDAPLSINFGRTLDTVRAQDLNADGILDLVGTRASGNTISVRLGNGDGSFEPGQELSVGEQPESLLIADFNGDGALDLANLNVQEDNISVFLGNNDGTFQAPQISPLNLAAFARQIVEGDFNGDGALDLVVLSGVLNGEVHLVLGQNDGLFAFQQLLSEVNNPAAIAAGDLNGDGIPDAIISSSISIFDEFSELSLLLSAP